MTRVVRLTLSGEYKSAFPLSLGWHVLKEKGGEAQ